MKRIAILAAPLALASCTTPQPYAMTDDARATLEDELEGLVAGEPQNCLDINSTSRSQVIDEKTILYRRGSVRYLQVFDNRCPGLGDFGNALVIEPFGGRICSNDTARIVDTSSGIPGGICAFGPFIPYREAD
ncbi:hypothetical protein [Sphingomicrobium sediminis]|uniref:Lipoprotein n=1 Tax=Sphingomicrobium sediminis TaxID=2950949 RepID=A0A9X2EM86_9SPHN|nr:hypothetical protein [Sphingomicrobium sediminis]MCM8557912.1 hypothetical protein [Sphingomicrobium sediminis]